MANLGNKDGIFVVRFRYQRKEYKRSLKTNDELHAKAAQKLVELTIHRLLTGQAVIREGVDPGDFIVSGGTWSPPPPPPPPPPVFPSTSELIDKYLNAREGECAESYLAGQRYHFNHFKKFLGKIAERPCNLVTRTMLENFLRVRKKVSDGETVNRHQVTLSMFYKWIALQDGVPPFPFPAEKLPRFKGSRDRDPFRTTEEIEETLARGGLDNKQKLDAWDALYLSGAQIAELLALVRGRSKNPLSFLLHAIPAYTGMRRGEILRLRWFEVDFRHDYITACSRKQSRSQQEVSRRIDLHPELKEHLLEWRKHRPHGQFVLSSAKTWRQITVDQAKPLFWQPLRRTTWCLDSESNRFKVAFHSYRHSFASNLAAAGIDQRLIDEFMGHQSEQMRKRYRHLFPKNRRGAILALRMGRPLDKAVETSSS